MMQSRRKMLIATLALTAVLWTSADASAAAICDPNCVSSCNVHGSGTCDTQCSRAYGLNSDTHKCERCDPHCAGTCDKLGPGHCDDFCESGWGWTTAYICIPCSPLCTSANASCNAGSLNCDGPCPFGYGITDGSSSRTCLPCDSHCAAGCTLAGHCDSTCKPGYGLNRGLTICEPCDVNCTSACNTFGPGKCDSNCSAGFILDSTAHLCQDINECANASRNACDVNANCTNTPGNYTCTCKAGFYGNGSICSKCDVNCVLTTCARYGLGTCDGTACKPGYTLNNSTHRCDPLLCDVHCLGSCVRGVDRCDSECKPGYQLNTNIYKCSDINECTAQSDPCNKSLTGAPVSCSNTDGGYLCICALGFVWNNGTCWPCDANCAPGTGCGVSGAGLCDGVCRQGFKYDPASKTCRACSAHCSVGCQSDGVGFCDSECDFGFARGELPRSGGKHLCFPCAQYCLTGCSVEGAGWCDADQQTGVGRCSRGRWVTVGWKHACR